MLDKSYRPLSALLLAPFRRHHWVSAMRWFRVYKTPFSVLRRYLWADDDYPAVITVNTAKGRRQLTAYSFHDLSTINEVFCRRDYPVSRTDRIAVDFGSNIGFTILNVLVSGADDALVYGFEPVPKNCERLRATLKGLEGQYVLEQCAIADYAGQVRFDLDDFGRYGGIGVGYDRHILVECRRARDVIERILLRHGQIDVLKIDIEGLEESVVRDLTVEQRKKIRVIYAELKVSENPISDTHDMQRCGTVRQFMLRQQY
jgi:FkbM family methyltransferase